MSLSDDAAALLSASEESQTQVVGIRTALDKADEMATVCQQVLDGIDETIAASMRALGDARPEIPGLLRTAEAAVEKAAAAIETEVKQALEDAQAAILAAMEKTLEAIRAIEQ